MPEISKTFYRVELSSNQNLSIYYKDMYTLLHNICVTELKFLHLSYYLKYLYEYNLSVIHILTFLETLF